MVSTLKRDINQNLQQLDTLQNELSTGRKINKPSDDPAGLVKALRLRTDITANEQYQTNIKDAISLNDTTDSALNSLNQVVTKIRELTVQAANGTNDTSALASITDEIDQLEEQIKTVANTTYGSKYVFAGSNVTEAPCSDTKWTGNDQLLKREIGSGVTIPVNVNMKSWFGNPDGQDAGISKSAGNPSTDISTGTADTFQIQVDGDATARTITLPDLTGLTSGTAIASAMQTAIQKYGTDNSLDAYKNVTVEYTDGRYVISSGTTGSSSSVVITGDGTASDVTSALKIGTANGGTEAIDEGIFNILDQLKTAVSAGDSDTINTLLDKEDQKIDDLLANRAVVGAQSNRLEMQQTWLQDTNTSLTDLLSNSEDADVTDVTLQYKAQENVYTASLQVGAQIIKPTLISFLS